MNSENNYEYLNNNKVQLSGKISSEPIFSHEVFGEGFYEFSIEVPRLSSQSDKIPVTISDRIIPRERLQVGMPFGVNGQFRSYNKLTDGKSKLMLTCFAREIYQPEASENPNSIELLGFVCKPPIFRITPFNREICDVLIAVNRAYNKSDYIPCIAWGRNARFLKNMQVGEKLFIGGRIQSREYTKKLESGEEVRTAYEVSISKVVFGNDLAELKTSAAESADGNKSGDGGTSFVPPQAKVAF